MKKLAKALALLALVIILVAVGRVAKNQVFGYKPEDFSDPPNWGVCLHPAWDPFENRRRCLVSGRGPTDFSGDYNVRLPLRQFASVPGTLDLLTPDRDTVSAPSFCGVFDGKLKPVTALYGVGIIGGITDSNAIEKDPPHLAGFNTSPGQIVYIPNFRGNAIGETDFTATLLFVGSDSTGDYAVVKYDRVDGADTGFTVYVFGLNIDPLLLDDYNQANSDGRWYLRGFKQDNLDSWRDLGTAKGSEIWIAGQFGGTFIDPRSRPNWWSGCPDGSAGKSSVTDPTKPPGFTQTPAYPISVIGPNETVFGAQARARVPIYKPLGSLEACPVEVPLNGKITVRNNAGTEGSISPSCQGPFDPDKYYHKETCEEARTEPDCCSQDAGSCAWEDRWWCHPEHCEGVGQRCGAGIDTFFIKGSQINNPNKNEGFSSNQKLPACIPAASKNQQCVSECSTPIDLTENLQMFPNAGCARNGDCLVNLKVDNSLNIPFVRYLGDYFTGAIDAEHMGTKDLDALQQAIRNGITDKLFANAGVAKKLMPASIQDQLKCQFRDYVIGKKKDGTNTKYLDRTDPNNIKELKIYDLNVTDMECPPSVDPKSQKYTDDDAWKKAGPPGSTRKWPEYWFAMPLFQNDDSQGEIQFVSPSIFSTKEPGNNPLFPKAVLGPVHISVPEVGRLAAATNLIQSALVPAELISQRTLDISQNPKMNLPTYGLPVDPVPAMQACRRDNWNSFYQDTTKIYYDTTQNLRLNADSLQNPNNEEGIASDFTDYTRGVQCNIPVLDGSEATNLSKVCVVGPEGQLRCYQQEPGSPDATVGQAKSFEEKVQVRTVVPNLFEIAETTIQRSTGFLRIFQPKDNQNTFETNYAPVPVAVPIKYEASDRDITIKENPDGWQLFFYRLGGLQTARNFVLKLLNPSSK